ncbi:cytochrome P450 [Hypoxylon sp. FL1150]|nr:cytochrome P450 [Hypoxylon sp. FL1150]
MSLFQTSLVAFLSFAITWAAYSWTCRLPRNYIAARKIGVSIRILPVSHENLLWTIVDRKVVSFFKKLPFPLGNGSFTRYNWRGWEVEDRHRSHLEMGDAYVHVTPGKNWLYLCDPEALMEVFERGSDFPRPLQTSEPLNIFGPNLMTVEGHQWERQRKIVAKCFSEQTNEIVWSESICLARDMLRYWGSKKSVGSVAEDTRTFSLHVLSRVGFGKSYKFRGRDEWSAASTASSYKESLKIILDNCVLIMTLGTKFLSKPWLPAGLRGVHQACVSFQAYMTKVYEDEKRALKNGRVTDTNLMTSLIRASHEEALTSEGLTSGGLTEKEIYGNIFICNFAGHDTTAHTLTFAIMFLAANPTVQDWLSEELHRVLGDRRPDNWNYASDFPRLKRCRAILMETVRLYTPVPIAKWTDNHAQTLKVGDTTIAIPPNTMVIPNYSAIHTHPQYWGSDSLSWRPSRWITKPSTNPNSIDEDIITPRRGVFIPWSEGERSCPGQKFSEVEFVAAIAGLFREWRVDPAQQKGEETAEVARARVLELIKKDSAQVLLLQMQHPERAPLVWRRR